MVCFKCGVTVANCKGRFGYYYFCPRCKKTFETSGQTIYNRKMKRKKYIE